MAFLEVRPKPTGAYLTDYVAMQVVLVVPLVLLLELWQVF
jgi:hypothetical protein